MPAKAADQKRSLLADSTSVLGLGLGLRLCKVLGVGLGQGSGFILGSGIGLELGFGKNYPTDQGLVFGLGWG